MTFHGAPWAWREDEAASRGPELGSCSLRAAGHGAGGGGLDVNIELSRLLIVKIRVTRGEAWGLSPIVLRYIGAHSEAFVIYLWRHP